MFKKSHYNSTKEISISDTKDVKQTHEASNPTKSSTSISATNQPSNNSKLQFTLILPSNWSSGLPKNGVIDDEKDKKIGEIGGVKTYEDSCINYFRKGFTDNSMGNKLDQWTQDIREKTWYVAHIDVPCSGECNWNVYCIEGENKIFTMYIDNSLAQSSPNLITETLSTFSFND